MSAAGLIAVVALLLGARWWRTRRVVPGRPAWLIGLRLVGATLLLVVLSAVIAELLIFGAFVLSGGRI